jgi:hypothetical protein
MSTIEVRLARLEDERAILELLHTYGRAIDDGLEADFSACWTEDATLVWNVTQHRPQPRFHPRRFDGRAAILEAFRGHTHAPEVFHKHILYAPLIRIEGDRGTVRSTFERHDEGVDGPLIRSFGRYHDEVQRCPDGRWRFTRRDAEIESSVTHPAPRPHDGAPRISR